MKKFNIRSFIMGIVIGALVCSSVAVAFAANYTATLKAVYRDIKVYVNGDQIDYYASNGAYAEPFIIKGTTYVPLRLFSEKTGNKVKWDGTTSSIFVLDKEHEHDLDLTPELAIGLAYVYGEDTDTQLADVGYKYTIERSFGKVELESDEGYLISFPMMTIRGLELTDYWLVFYYVDKESNNTKYIAQAGEWDPAWIDMRTGTLTKAYYDYLAWLESM